MVVRPGRVVQAFAAALETELGYEDEYLLHPAGGAPARIVQAIGRTEKDAGGVPVRVVGFIQYVTERRHAEQELVAARITA